MKPRFGSGSTSITPKRNDQELSDSQFWGRFEQICLKLHQAFPDFSVKRKRDTWEFSSKDPAALEAWEELALIFCKRLKLPMIKTRGDAVQALLWTIFANEPGDNAANAILRDAGKTH